MDTVSIVIKKSEQKADGTWRVYYQVGHKSKTDWIPTDVFVDKSQVNKAYDIKDQDVLDDLDTGLKAMRRKIRHMGDIDIDLLSN